MAWNTFMGYDSTGKYPGTTATIDKKKFKLNNSNYELLSVIVVLSANNPGGLMIQTSPSGLAGNDMNNILHVFVSDPVTPDVETEAIFDFNGLGLDTEIWINQDKTVARELHSNFFSKDCRIRFRFVLESNDIVIDPVIPLP